MDTAVATYRVRTGLVAGRGHLLDGRNCQDELCQAAFEIDGGQYIVGVVADGCGEGKHSEVGARLAVEFIVRESRRLVGEGTAPEQFSQLLFEQVLRFLRGIVGGYSFSDPRDYVKFVEQHLLFTINGFVVGPQQTIVFTAGDGIVILNDHLHRREQHNAPSYIGYQLIDRHYLQASASPLPEGFEQHMLPSAALQRMAIGSDAWLQEEALLEQIWGAEAVVGLQLRMNRWSDARHFGDDASLIVVERVASTKTGAN